MYWVWDVVLVQFPFVSVMACAVQDPVQSPLCQVQVALAQTYSWNASAEPGLACQ